MQSWMSRCCEHTLLQPQVQASRGTGVEPLKLYNQPANGSISAIVGLTSSASLSAMGAELAMMAEGAEASTPVVDADSSARLLLQLRSTLCSYLKTKRLTRCTRSYQ